MIPNNPKLEDLLIKKKTKEKLKDMFLSSYENKIDKKGRVSVPAAFRSHLNNPRLQWFYLLSIF